MELLQTPEDAFDAIEGFDHPVHDTDVGGVRIAHVEAGDGPPVLLMHGEPSWGFLYRAMIPPLVSAGFRVVVPDLVGFGRSDKPARQEDHTYERHVAWMVGWLDAVGLDGITLFCQDWGGLIGLRMVAARPDRFARVAAANTGLPTGSGSPSPAFTAWAEFARTTDRFHVGAIVAGGTASGLSNEVIAAYDAPFPDDRYLAGPRVMPGLVPTTPDDPSSGPNRAAWEVLSSWEKPFLTLFSDGDPITAGGERVFQARVPGAAGQPHRTIAGAGHFLQEDAGPELARSLTDWVGSVG